jgi:hypothetical protein
MTTMTTLSRHRKPSARAVATSAAALAASLAVGSALFAAAPAARADDKLGVTIGGEFAPGVWGRIELGQRQPPPVLLYPQPVVVPHPAGTPAVVMPHGYAAAPLYVVAPPGHIRHWAHWCGYYGACGRPVYFVDPRHARRHHVQPVRFVQPVVYPAPAPVYVPPPHHPPRPHPHGHPVYPR